MSSQEIPNEQLSEDSSIKNESVEVTDSKNNGFNSTADQKSSTAQSTLDKSTPTSGEVTTDNAGNPKRRRRKILKKAMRACNHCRNAHITCDDSRPCKRCVKKGLQDTCTDAPRKTKKYLLAAEAELELQKKQQEQEQAQLAGIPFSNKLPNASNDFSKIPIPTDISSRSSSPFLMPIKDMQQQQQQQQDNLTTQLPPIINNDTNNGLNAPTRDIEYGNFLSQAADLEYSILGSMVQNPAFFDNILSTSPSVSNSDDGRMSASPQNMGYQSMGSMSRSQSLPTPQQQQAYINQAQNNNNNNNNSNNNLNNNLINEEGQNFMLTNGISNGSNNTTKRKSRSSYLDDPKLMIPSPLSMNGSTTMSQSLPGPKCDTHTNQYFIGATNNNGDDESNRAFTFPEVVKLISEFRNKDPMGFQELNKKSAISFSIGKNEEDEKKEEAITHDYPCGLRFKEPMEIYSKINEPFSYVQPYHDLITYLRKRFQKSRALVSMAKSMAEYRPSFIAGMIRLKYDDLKFAEQCFQRTLLEYDNYIKISGTPTLVWRRTSQIAYVGDEFCILTGWNKEQLLGKSTFAVEIMDDKSCVEYFQLFSKIAFGDFKGATMTECTLLTPNGENIRTSSVWTLKRDVFGIPMMIIANFLPSLN